MQYSIISGPTQLELESGCDQVTITVQYPEGARSHTLELSSCASVSGMPTEWDFTGTFELKTERKERGFFARLLSDLFDSDTVSVKCEWSTYSKKGWAYF